MLNKLPLRQFSLSIMNCKSTPFSYGGRRLMQRLPSFLLFSLVFYYTSIVAAEGLISYAGFNVHQASVNLDEFGATSIEDETYEFGLFAASRLYKNLYLEYGYNDLGEYTASYDFTVGSFRFVESHKVDFSRTIYVGLVAKASIAEILEAFELKPALEKVYAHVALGGLLWRAELEMEGTLYDSGTLLSPYGATGDDTGLSGYYEFGLGYEISENYILALTLKTYLDVGKGVELQLLDGTKKEYAGIDVDTVGLGFTYMF
jgi:hypothetical protein